MLQYSVRRNRVQCVFTLPHGCVQISELLSVSRGAVSLQLHTSAPIQNSLQCWLVQSQKPHACSKCALSNHTSQHCFPHRSLRASPARSSTPTQRETPREEHDYATLKSQTPAAANPSSTGEVSCDHSDPSDEKPVPAALPVTPPKKPPRSRSREHFYHSLECSSERGNRSNSNSLNRRSITILASQIKDLFDDPNYAATTVQPPAQLGGRDLSRSTPSLVTAGVQLRPPYVWERASFRMVRNTRRVIQKRRSDIVDRDS